MNYVIVNIEFLYKIYVQSKHAAFDWKIQRLTKRHQQYQQYQQSILKEILPDILPFITTMCNRSLEEGWLPESQRHAILKPILKKDGLDAKDVKSYRPISNLTFISKLVERLVNLQLTEFLEKSGLFPKLQSGFRARHSTETALLKVMSDIMASTDKGNITLLGLLDMSAAFDTVDHHILLDRLEVSYGLKGHVLSWLRSFLSNRTQQVLMNGSSSLVTRIKSGVPQGSILGPLLFLLYTADIPCLATKHGINIHCYADDGQLYLYSRADMADNVVKKVVGCISEIDAWMSSNRLKLNADKTQFTWLGTRQQLDKINIPSINLGSSAVQLQSYVNNLGVIFDQKLSMKQHVDKISRSAFYYLRQLRVIRKSLTTKACEALVHAFVSSRLDYCNCLLYGVGENSWNDYSPFFVPPPVSCFANSNTTRSLPIYGTDFTGFPWSKESSSRFAYSFSSVDPTRLQFTSPRCCMRSNARRDTTSVLIRDSTMTFLDVPPFALDPAVLLFPARHSGTVYQTH